MREGAEKFHREVHMRRYVEKWMRDHGFKVHREFILVKPLRGRVDLAGFQDGFPLMLMEMKLSPSWALLVQAKMCKRRSWNSWVAIPFGVKSKYHEVYKQHGIGILIVTRQGCFVHAEPRELA